ncbi:hypothetical protein [Klebsiella spallanzanii]|uniref:hypothetical protein n=1 Tax=Klebsiella spallanzanii TaxID=2587528 RepID=UPI002593CB85|nr:hypothetical protein [Klebsiella spallanzanii]MDM4207878.1 hypothetical protein [Klebsiella spallanzanii]
MKEVSSELIKTAYVGCGQTILSQNHAAGDLLNVNPPGGQTPAYTADSSLIKKKPL